MPGLCYDCGRPAVADTSRCERCGPMVAERNRRAVARKSGQLVIDHPRASAPTTVRSSGRIVIPKSFPKPTLQNRAFVEEFLGDRVDDSNLYQQTRAKARGAEPKPRRKDFYLSYLYVLKFYHPRTQELIMQVLKRGVSNAGKGALVKRFGEAFRYGADVEVIRLESFDTEEEAFVREAEYDIIAEDLGGMRWSEESYFLENERIDVDVA